MKKLLLSIFAVATLFSCSKSDITYEQDETAIGFAPIAKNITKSVAGVGSDGKYDATFPTNLNLYVFANAQKDDLSDAWPDTYFENAKFIYSRLANNVYEGETPHYWPNVKSLIFAGYSNACNIDEIAANSEVDFENNTITITGYTQNNKITGIGTNDLMWFPWDGKSYKKQTTAIDATMKHACSWITVKVVSDGKFSDLKLHDLTINGLYHTGTATCANTSATWATYGNQENENLFSNEEGVSVSKTEQIFENIDNNFIVIPQRPTTIAVSYSFVPQEGVEAIKETKTLSLTIGDKTDLTTRFWESGKHYIYTIKITATEILINPEVAEWVDATVTPGTTI